MYWKQQSVRGTTAVFGLLFAGPFRCLRYDVLFMNMISVGITNSKPFVFAKSDNAGIC